MASQSQSRFKRPESVLVVVYTRRSEVLLLERVRPPGAWQSVTGSLKWGEPASAAAVRELAEETGLRNLPVVDCECRNTFEILPPWGGGKFAPGVTCNEESVFSVMLPEICNVALHPQEHTRAIWLPREAAAQKVFSWTNRDAILEFVP
ncbi:MAG: dihydroneopterin triphosphate diphosphatase [Gammaproteobacteria bacterium]|nr:dihydroneopterin triphosphate diphosphatase [Gammaproteobacteria bacterium]